MRKNELYELRVMHPTIDGVGLLREEGSCEDWLVFIQVSLSHYSRHCSKLPDIFKNKYSTKSMPLELKNSKKGTSFFYRRLAGIKKNVT